MRQTSRKEVEPVELEFVCEYCGKTFHVAASLISLTVTCPFCSKAREMTPDEQYAAREIGRMADLLRKKHFGY